MVNGYPKTPLLRIDGERGFVFCGPGKTHRCRTYAAEGFSIENLNESSTWMRAADGIKVRVYDDYDALVGCYLVNGGGHRSIVDKLK